MTYLAFSEKSRKFLVISDKYVGSQQFKDPELAIDHWKLKEYFDINTPSASTGRTYAISSDKTTVLVKYRGMNYWEPYANIIETIDDEPSDYEYW